MKEATDAMSYTYDHRKRPQGQQDAGPEQTAAAGPDFNALMTGAAQPSAAQKGRPIDLDGAMKAKMEHAFGDLSAVKLYESDAVGQAGAEAVAQGNEIAFAPGMTDFSSRAGQERLGHELSHVMSQRSGAVRGEGFLASASLEARADREGAMAAAGEQIYTGPVTSSISSASPSPAVAGPMQAKRGGKQTAAASAPTLDIEGPILDTIEASDPTKNLIPAPSNGYERFASTPELNPMNMSKMTRNFDLMQIGKLGMGDHYYPQMKDLSLEPNREGRDELFERIKTKHENRDVYEEGMGTPQNSTGSVKLSQSGGPRMIKDLWGSQTSDMSDEEIETLFDNMYAPMKKELRGPNADPQKVKEADEKFDSAMYKLKDIYYKQLKRLEATYGTLPTQMHPEDFLKQVGPEYFEHSIGQDWSILMRAGNGKYFDFENNEKDQEFKRLKEYYQGAGMQLYTYGSYVRDPSKGSFENISPRIRMGADREKGIGGPSMDKKQLKQYKKDLKRRSKQGGWSNRLFGRYK